MIITNIESHLLATIEDAEEIWIAVALINEGGYQKIQAVLRDTKQHYLIGVDLPTAPSVLYQIKEHLRPGSFEARLAKYREVFHPKVYIAKKAGRLQAIVGSANLTEAGLRGNHEICYMVTDQEQCRELIQWFQGFYNRAYPLTPENIAEYDRHYNPDDQGSSSGSGTGRPLNFTRPSEDELFFDNLDLSGYFFGKEDYLAFRQNLQPDKRAPANRERKAVWDKFRDLHRIIFPQFQTYGIGALDHHRRDENIVSHYSHADGYTSQYLNAMWLSYGKNRDEISEYQSLFTPLGNQGNHERDRQSFINHARLQVRIEVHSLGIWILFAKNNGSDFDRGHFRDQMNIPQYRQSFLESLRALPEPYWIRVNNVRHPVSFFVNSDQLLDFTRADRPEEYFTIGRDYEITDRALLQTQLAITVLEEFRRLFPLYGMMRHRLS
jgi:HKD family nuclease